MWRAGPSASVVGRLRRCGWQTQAARPITCKTPHLGHSVGTNMNVYQSPLKGGDIEYVI